MSLVTALTAASVFGVGGALHLRAEERELWSTAEAEMTLLTRSIQVAVENALRDQQMPDVVEQLRALERIEPDVDVSVYGLDGAEQSTGTPSSALSAQTRSSAATAALRGRGSAVTVSSDRETGYLLAAAPLRDDADHPLGSLVLSRSSKRIDEDLRTTRNNIVAVVGAFVVLAFALSLTLCELYVGRRLTRLAEALRRTAAGDYEIALEPGARDEVGLVVREFDNMATQLAAARAELEARLEEKRHAERALQRADRLAVIGQLSAAVAHEIGSPLQIISGRAQSLMKHAEDSERTRRAAAILSAQADRIVRTAENLLAFARHRPVRFDSIDPGQAVAEVVELLEIEARRLDVRIVVAREPPVPRIIAMRDHLQQVALNLIRNSLAACPRGGSIEVRLTAAADASRVPGLRMIIDDTGPGIPPDVLEHLFEPFFTTRLGEGGTGLGLAVVRSIVDEHSGSIRIESREDQGTRVIVWLPEIAPRSQLVQISG